MSVICSGYLIKTKDGLFTGPRNADFWSREGDAYNYLHKMQKVGRYTNAKVVEVGLIEL